MCSSFLRSEFAFWMILVVEYLHFLSVHPDHSKHFIVFSQTLSVSGICSHEKDSEKHLENGIMAP